MPTPVPFDPNKASETELRAVHELYLVTETEQLPDDPPRPFEERLGSWLHRPSFQEVRRWAMWDGDRALGTAMLSLEYLEQNRDQAWFWIQVHRDHRRKGLGTHLLRGVLEGAKAGDRTMLGTWTWHGSDAEGFLDALGATKRQEERISRCWVKDVDLGLMERWVARAPERASGYELVLWEGQCPEELLERYADVRTVMNTAPRDDLEMEDWVMTPTEVRDWEEANAKRGLTWWTMCARHRSTGALVGYTELFFEPHRPYQANQGDTGVDPTHRSRGLGRWLKAAMFLKLIAERPEVDRIDTGNAESNAPMLAINVEMGFRPLLAESVWQVPLETAEAAFSS